MRFAVIMLYRHGRSCPGSTDTRAVAGGGISVPGWSGKMTPTRKSQG